MILVINQNQAFIQISNGFWQNRCHLSVFQMVELPDFISHSKFRRLQTPNKIQIQIQTSPDFRSPLYFYSREKLPITFMNMSINVILWLDPFLHAVKQLDTAWNKKMQSHDLNTKHSKSGNIWKPEFFSVWYWYLSGG